MKFHFSTVVWGPWHTGVFLDVNLPSLMAPNNLAAFAVHHDVIYRIFTSGESARQIGSSPVFQRARDIVPFEIIEFDIDPSVSPIQMHHRLWQRSIAEARDAGAMVLFVPPDVIWADGSFQHVAEIALRGKRAIFMTYMRVVAEDCVAEVRRRHLKPDGIVVDAQPRELVELAMRYIHPLTLTYLRDSPNFPIHPELVLWSIPGEGMLMRVLVREVFAFDPRLFDLNEVALLAHAPDPNLVHYITDSDDLFSLSLAPLQKDIDWYSKRAALDVLTVGRWWLAYDSPANDAVADKYFHIQLTDRTKEKWRRAELASDALIQRLRGSREILRLLSMFGAGEMDCAAQVVTLALVDTKLARRVQCIEPFTALIPRNDALLQWLSAGGTRLLRPGPSRPLVNLILDHCITANLHLRKGQEATLTTARGNLRRLTWRGDVPLIDGVAVQGEIFPIGYQVGGAPDKWGVLIDAVLPFFG